MVWNGVEVADVDAESLALPENLGVTGGRMRAAAGEAEFLLFLDDDAELVSIDRCVGRSRRSMQPTWRSLPCASSTRTVRPAAATCRGG